MVNCGTGVNAPNALRGPIVEGNSPMITQAQPKTAKPVQVMRLCPLRAIAPKNRRDQNDGDSEGSTCSEDICISQCGETEPDIENEGHQLCDGETVPSHGLS